MRKMVGLLFFAVAFLISVSLSPSAGAQENTFKVGDSFQVKAGDAVWDVKVTSYDEVPEYGNKVGRVYIDFKNVSESETKVLRASIWKGYLVGADQSSQKIQWYHRYPGDQWWHEADVLPGALYHARLEAAIAKEFVTKQFLLQLEVGTPAQVRVEIPSSGTMASAPPTQASQGVMAEPSGVSPVSSPATPVESSASAAQPQSLEQQAVIGYGLVIGHSIGVSGKYWAMPTIGGQLIGARRGVDSVVVGVRLLYKVLATPLGNVYIGPEVGYQFSTTGSINRTGYGIVAGAEMIMPLPVYLAAQKSVEHKGVDMWFWLADKAKALGVSFEVGGFGTGIRNIATNQLTLAFNMAGHIYLSSF